MSQLNPKCMKKILLLICVLALVSSCQKQVEVETQQFEASEVIYPSDDKPDSMVVEINIEIPTLLPVDSSLSPIQQNILEQLFGKRFASLAPEEAMWAYIRMNQDEYLRMNREQLESQQQDESTYSGITDDQEESLTYTFSEENYISARLMDVVGNIFSYSIEQYVYMGGAHGIGTRFFYNYDMTTGNLLKEEMLFSEGYKEELTQLLRHNLVLQTEDLHSDSDLENSEFRQESIVPNNNFCIQSDGISWHFNPYDIAPYAYGDTDIFVPAKELKPLLRAEIELW